MKRKDANTIKCIKILNNYDILVDFEGTCKEGFGKGKKDNETLSTWKNRVLGPDARNVRIYRPVNVPAHTKIKTLREESAGSRIKKILYEVSRMKEAELKGKISKREQELMDEINQEHQNEKEALIKRYTTVATNTLSDVVANFKDTLEPSVKEFFDKFLKDDSRSEIDIEELLTELTKRYNAAVRTFRESKGL
jgi:hypothetical protein